MEKLSDNNIKGICTVKELVSRLKLSRARFYQLQNRGVFPKPDRCGRSNRPFYTPDMQRKCLEIRRTGIGYDGEPVVFNAPRQREGRSIQAPPHYKCQEFAQALRQLGLTVKPDMVKDAINSIYPEGIPSDADDGIISHKLYKYFTNGCKKDV